MYSRWLSLKSVAQSFYRGICSFSILLGKQEKLIEDELTAEGLLTQDLLNIGDDFKHAILKAEGIVDGGYKTKTK